MYINLTLTPTNGIAIPSIILFLITTINQLYWSLILMQPINCRLAP